MLTAGHLEISDALAIVGPGPELITIDAQENSRVVNASTGAFDVVVRGLTLTGGDADIHGGAILMISSGTLAIEHCVIVRNSAGNSGGGVYVASGDLTVSNSVINDNLAVLNGGGILSFSESGSVAINSSSILENSATNGGGIYTQRSDLVTVSSSTIAGNSASNVGGGIGALVGPVTVTSSTITGNSATSGAGINIRSGALELFDTTVSENSAVSNAGGLRAGSVTVANSMISENSAQFGGGIRSYGPVIVNDSEILGNSATTRHGGGIYTNSGSITIANSVIANNVARDRRGTGGGVHTVGGDVNVVNSTISKNSAGGIGGGIHQTFGEVTVADSTISGNAANTGGGIFSGNGSVSVTGSTISGNTAITLGGGFMTGPGELTIDETTVSRNSADSGGGIFARLGSVSVDHSIIVGNSAADGGGIFIDGEDLTVSNSTVTRNSANDNGGGIFTDGGSAIVINSVISGNSADIDGGGVYLSFGSTQVTDSTIAENAARDDGGGIATRTGSINIEGSIVSGNNATNDDGGGIYVESGSVSVNNSTIAGNSANTGGGVFALAGSVNVTSTQVAGNTAHDNGGGIFTSTGAVNVVDSTISGNTTTSTALSTGGGGGIRTARGMVSVTGSMMIENHSGTIGGGIHGGSGDVRVTGSTISRNTADLGGGIFTGTAPVAITNSTVSENAATRRNGLDGASGGGILAGGPLTLSHSTVFKNTSVFKGGGIYLYGDEATISSSIIAGNSDEGLAPDFDSNGNTVTILNSLLGNNTGSGVAPGSTNIVGTDSSPIDAGLGLLADNGGPTPTHGLLPGSPALNNGAANGETFDQRGAPRDDGNGVDMGAFELQQFFVVNSRGDSGDASPVDGVCDDGGGNCTLRAAIEEANAQPNVDPNSADMILFDMSGAAPHVIQPLSPLPNLTDSVIVDGTSQSGFDPATHLPVVEIDGTNAGAGASGFTISGGGGDSVIRGLAVNRFDAHGIFVSRRHRVTIEHNFIGTDPTGTTDLGNGEAGVYVINGESNVVHHNVISGNDQYGVKIEGPQSTGNVVTGNMIGTDATGASRLKNRLVGVEIAGSPNNTIGGSAAGHRNIISGNKFGISIRGAAATGNQIQGNYIGTNVTADAAIRNTRGVSIQDADGNTVGGSGDVGNVISGNTHGVYILRGEDNLVHGNMIGTDATGTAALANTRGAQIRDGVNNQIGNEPNVISGNVREGVKIFGSSATGNVVRDNFIGTNTDGDAAIPNRDGVVIRAGATGNTVGGSNPGEGNLISGNTEAGVFIFADDNDVIGNMIGVDVAGGASIPNETGVLIHRAAGNQIGGAAAGAGNVISGNSNEGILISGTGASGNQVEGNLVGTDVTGGTAIGNKHGIVIEAPANSVGGAAEGAGNVISGNSHDGVYLRGGAVGNSISGNRIGTDASGTAAVANGRSGVLVEDASGNTIGGTAATAGNMIGGNDQQGVKITGVGATGNILQGNTIGLHTPSGVAVPNRDGVRISDRASGNTIGGAVSGAANIIAHNSSRGVWVNDGIQNIISRNSLHQNRTLGLDLGPSGLTANDADDQDGGANLRQNFPVIESVLLVGPELDVRYSISSSAANSSYPIVVDFFLADSAGQEGETFLEAHTVNAPGTTTVSIAAGDAAVGQRVVATATDSLGNTSEFSAAAVIDGPMVQITEIPDYGVDGFISGVVSGVDAATHVVAPYIQIEGAGWWTKPTFGAPTVPINPDGTFSADVASPGTLDNRATIFAAAVIPVGNTPPQAEGTARIPSGLDDMAVAINTVERFGRTIDFAGRTWGIKEAPLPVGPGNNRFSDEPTDVFVDQDGLHLTVNFHDGEWWATEVVLLDELGYGTYSFQTNSEVDDLDVNVTFGAFTWDPYGDDESGASQHREIDFEDGRWGNASDPTNAQTVVQPFDTPGNLHRYTIPDLSSDPALTRFFTWRKDQIEFTALSGHHAQNSFSADDVIDQNTYSHDPPGNHFVPTMGRESFRFNLWIIGSQTQPADGQSVEVVVNDFNFTPLNPTGQPLFAESAVTQRAAEHLEQHQLGPIFDAAIDLLRHQQVPASLYSNVEIAIADLPGATLGLATHNSITIDTNAAGHGWFIDNTPLDDSEFDASLTDSVAPRGMDLLTVVMHELGHVAGLDDLYDEDFEDDLMYGWLESGIRKSLLSASLADEAFAQF
jgi:CSLREA domain-containing protein